MVKRFSLFLISAVFSLLALHSTAMSTQEDTAQLTFSKTALPKNTIHRYTVQKEDVLSAIIRKIPGVTEKDIPDFYRKIKELNPEIEDLNKLYVGQKIVLPRKSTDTAEEKASPIETGVQTTSPGVMGFNDYKVKKGDNLIRIVHRELHIKSNTQKTLLLIKSLNPSLTNAHKIYVGQIIHLPDGRTSLKAKEFPKQPEKSIERKAQEVSLSEEQTAQAENVVSVNDSIALSPEARIAVIKHIITQMSGTMFTTGKYYLPISKTDQLTVDCSIIPVLELDDKTTIFLDFENRSDNHLKKMITDRWSNYHLVKIDAKDDIIIMLKKIFKNTKTYEITKSQKPVSVGSLPPLEFLVDWLITRNNIKQSSAVSQGLRFVYEDTALMPRAIVNYARWHSFIITEISPTKGLVGKPEEIYSLSPVTVLTAPSARDFSYNLLSYLNIPAEKDVDVKIFNLAQDGFNLSIKADIVVTRGEKKTVIFSRTLPPQFVGILQKGGSDLIFISDQDDPAKNMEKILRSFHFAFTSGYFSFSGVDKNQPPYNFGFNGTKIKTDKDIYVVNFDFNHDLRGLMQEIWSANIVRY